MSGRKSPANLTRLKRVVISGSRGRRLSKRKLEIRSGKVPEPMPVALAAPVYPAKRKGEIRLLLQAEKQISAGRCDGHAVRAVGGGDGISAARPTAAG